ncbi:MAG TPA: hypothetical protein PLV83_04915, partial [Bacilli bacterium]|nr:hypothetical protein [Bacilli bacterium]
MKDEEIETLSLDDEFDENVFMLNDNSSNKEVERKKIIKEDYIDDKTVPLEDLVVPEMPKSREQRNASLNNEEIKEVKPIIKKEKIKKDKPKKEKVKKEGKKSNGFKIPSTKKGKRIYLIQAIFCSVSILFVLGCSIFYGGRLIKYYKIYNPKTEGGETIALIGSSITEKASYTTSGEGLYKLGGASVYKGSNVNNYIRFSNQLWRIISVNADGSLEIALNDSINALSFNAKYGSFKDSNINKYINDKFLKALNKDYLTTTSICLDNIEDIANITCNNTDSENYVRLIGVSELLNSKVDGKTFLASTDGYWLYNTSKTGAWHVSGSSLADSSVADGYLVKPVVRIKNSAQLLGGTGTEADPYYIEKDNTDLQIGNYVKLGNDTWVIYDTNET